jgi:hypothetical protein
MRPRLITKRPCLAALLVVCSGLAAIPLGASSIARTSLKEQVIAAQAICRGTVLQVSSFRDPVDRAIKTRALIKIDEVLKGTFPEVLQLLHDGDNVEGEGRSEGFSPRLKPGERRLFLLGRRSDGHLGAVNGFASALDLAVPDAGGNSILSTVRSLCIKGTGGADVRDQAVAWSGMVPALPVTKLDTTGLLVDTTYNVPSRYLLPDRGEPIEYLVDAGTLRRL